MSLDILGALRRAFTLPAHSNSLQDVLGTDVAVTVSATMHTIIGAAASNALVNMVQAGEADLENIRSGVVHAIVGALWGVSPSLATRIGNAVDAAITDVELTAASDVPAVTSAVLSEISKALHI